MSVVEFQPCVYQITLFTMIWRYLDIFAILPPNLRRQRHFLFSGQHEFDKIRYFHQFLANKISTKELVFMCFSYHELDKNRPFYCFLNNMT